MLVRGSFRVALYVLGRVAMGYQYVYGGLRAFPHERKGLDNWQSQQNRLLRISQWERCEANSDRQQQRSSHNTINKYGPGPSRLTQTICPE